MRLLHSRDRRARRGLACEGSWLAGRPRSGARGPPLPLYRLGDRLRGHRLTRLRLGAPPRGGSGAEDRAGLEGGVPQRVGPEIPLGEGGFADDGASRDALVAVPLPPGSDVPSIAAAGRQWVVADSLHEARALAAKVQGRRTTADMTWPLSLPPLPPGGVRLAPGGWSRRTSSPMRPGANREERRRHRSRTAEHSAGKRPLWSPRLPASSPTMPDGWSVSCSRGRTSCGSGPNVRPIAATAVVHGRRVLIERRRRRSDGRVHRADRVAVPDRRDGNVGAGAGSRPAHRNASPRGGVRRTSCLAGGRAERVRDRSRGARVRRTRRERAPRQLRAGRRAARLAARGWSCTRTAPSRACWCASPRVIPSTTSCCVPTRSAPRTWRSDGCSPKASPSTPRPARCTTSPFVPSV